MSIGPRLIVGVFEDRMEAERAVDELEQAGFPHHDIGFALRGADVSHGGMLTDAVGSKDGKGAVAGMVTGGVVGGLLGAALALALPPLGPVLLGGILATAAGYAGAGAAVGGILGALTGAGMTEEEARYYEREFHAGKALLTVRAGERESVAVAIIRRHGGADMTGDPTKPPSPKTEAILAPPAGE